MKWTRAIGVALATSAVLALVAGIRLMLIDRVPDGTLLLGLAVALGTSGVMLLLVDRQMARRSERALMDH